MKNLDYSFKNFWFNNETIFYLSRVGAFFNSSKSMFTLMFVNQFSLTKIIKKALAK